jgi:hypothetical protein
MNSNYQQLDRLVDGSLPPSEYRAFLASLDEEPGAWRKCALAFLEAQALSQELGSLVPAAPTPVKSVSPTNQRASWKNAALALAMAASFAGALAVGVLSSKFFRERGQDAPFAGNLKVQTADDSHLAQANGGRHQVLRPVGNVNLIVEGLDGAGSTGQVPVYEVGADLEAVLAREEASLGPELIDLFRQYGYEVRHEQQYVPAPLDDGRQVIVPVHGYEIRPVSRTY